MAIQSNKYPPKFSQNVLYPAIYNLDEYDMPSNMDLNPGNYFNITFTGQGINQTPALGYGKHKFELDILDTPENMPKLKGGSRILFEFKDPAGTVIFSDTTPLSKTSGFIGYVWIKQDPMRTFEDIKEGWGTMTIVAKTLNENNLWRNRYNVRITQNIYIDFYSGTDIFRANNSTLIFQNNTGSMGQQSNAVSVSEVITENTIEIEQDDGTIIQNTYNQCNAQISQSFMKTYSGKVEFIQSFIKVSGSAGHDEPPWIFLSDHPVVSSSFEDHIYKDYGEGVNSLSEKWLEPIPSNILPYTDNYSHKVRFKLLFKSPDNQIAKDYSTYTGVSVPEKDFQILYPETEGSWLTFGGGEVRRGGNDRQNVYDPEIVFTGAGVFSFTPDAVSAPRGGGMEMNSNGSLNGFNDPAVQGPGSGDGSD